MHKSFGENITMLFAPNMLDVELQILFAQLDFGLVLVPSLLSMSLFITCRMEMFNPCHYILDYIACFDFYGVSC